MGKLKKLLRIGALVSMATLGGCSDRNSTEEEMSTKDFETAEEYRSHITYNQSQSKKPAKPVKNWGKEY